MSDGPDPLARARQELAAAGLLTDLRSLFERRSYADYRAEEVPSAEAQQAVLDAGTVVDAVEAWLQRS